LKIIVHSSSAHVVEDDSLLEGAEKIFSITFQFEEGWEGYTKSALFKIEDTEYPPVPLTDDYCDIPAECLEQGGVRLKIGVTGEKDGETKGPIWCYGSRVLAIAEPEELIPPSVSGGTSGGNTSGGTSSDDIATDQEVDEVLDEIFDSTGAGSGSGSDTNPDSSGGMESGTESGGSSDNVATDQEVEDVLDDVFGE